MTMEEVVFSVALNSGSHQFLINHILHGLMLLMKSSTICNILRDGCRSSVFQVNFLKNQRQAISIDFRYHRFYSDVQTLKVDVFSEVDGTRWRVLTPSRSIIRKFGIHVSQLNLENDSNSIILKYQHRTAGKWC